MRSHFRFKTRRRRMQIGLVGALFACFLVCLGFFAVYRFFDPFASLNPLYHEVTVGEKVIDNWIYEGKDKDGYLEFYCNYEIHVLPPTAHELALDGKYVVIENATNNSLTFAQPVDSLPYQWLIPVFCLLLVLVLFYIRQRKRRVLFKKTRSLQTKRTKYKDW